MVIDSLSKATRTARTEEERADGNTRDMNLAQEFMRLDCKRGNSGVVLRGLHRLQFGANASTSHVRSPINESVPGSWLARSPSNPKGRSKMRFSQAQNLPTNQYIDLLADVLAT